MWGRVRILDNAEIVHVREPTIYIESTRRVHVNYSRCSFANLLSLKGLLFEEIHTRFGILWLQSPSLSPSEDVYMFCTEHLVSIRPKHTVFSLRISSHPVQ